MKRLLAWSGAVLLAIACLLAGLVWFLNLPAAPSAVALPSGPASAETIARGAVLARAGNCAGCHTARGGIPWAGGRPVETPFGNVVAGNITADPETGIGLWSAADFRQALHDGRARDGRLLYPAFPYTHFTRVRAEDADALYAYLRSVPAVRQTNPPHALRWPYNTQAALAVWRALHFRKAAHADDSTRTAEWNRGAYLVNGLGHCGACHSARNALGGTWNMLDLSGGLIPMQNWYAPSLAASNEAGVQGWPIDEVVGLLKAGTSPRGTVLGPMAEVVLHSTQHLPEADLRAMAVFLKDLADTPSAAPPASAARAPAATLAQGRELYDRHCAQCHGEQGRGVPGAYPPLAGNRALRMHTTTNLVQIVLYGGFAPATRGNPQPYGMPPFATVLSDAEVAAVLSYLRDAWGNQAAGVAELDVARQRGSVR